jgi:hypothetical protein
MLKYSENFALHPTPQPSARNKLQSASFAWPCTCTWLPTHTNLCLLCIADCATLEADEKFDVGYSDNTFELDYKVLAKPLPDFFVTGRGKRGANNTVDFRLVVTNVGLAPGAPGVVSVYPDAFQLPLIIDCKATAGAGWVSAAAVTTPLDVGRSVVVNVKGVRVPSLPLNNFVAVVAVDSTCITTEIFDAYQSVVNLSQFEIDYKV